MSGLTKIAKDKKNVFMCHIARIYNAIRRIIKNLLFLYTKKICRTKKKQRLCESKIEKQSEKYDKQKLSLCVIAKHRSRFCYYYMT